MKRIMKAIVLLVLLGMSGLCASQAFANSEKTWFEEANAAYNDGDYEQALVKYSQVLDLGLESAPLYYNMGNAYYKMKDYPHAILYYEKALKLDPGNEDIRTNLDIANMAIVDKIERIPQHFISRWWNGLKSLFSVDGWAWVSVISFALVLLCLFMFLLARRTGWRKVGFFMGLPMLAVMVLSIVFAIGKYRDVNTQDKAIVMTPTVTVKSSPSVSSVDLFVLHEGTKVRILDTAKDWNKIRIADGSVGWIQMKDVTAF
ncbi:MAG: tetratricopeptide repeat protein [Bacteroidales bacterium]|nr:tetratricopeptide repeat protein [Bacteroidales bacterium]